MLHDLPMHERMDAIAKEDMMIWVEDPPVDDLSWRSSF